ncbi:hypothetical protein PoB_004305800 [Plakobranchus ocellatus]|uniref:Uncharacterized protein n=1 Tax=Plakobranchus ocellatus TaxID=259542 RepID=A0AAV4BAD3_9GAST|nr:hypothetical protein PoB_004305800 [Plakobranchus ocellatus]
MPVTCASVIEGHLWVLITSFTCRCVKLGMTFKGIRRTIGIQTGDPIKFKLMRMVIAPSRTKNESFGDGKNVAISRKLILYDMWISEQRESQKPSPLCDLTLFDA